MKPHYQVPIQDCGEPLVPIPPQQLAFVTPHPYEQLGAPYGNRSPFCLRQTVCDRLLQAQSFLEQRQPGWRLQVFDAYRPLAVQQFMVDYTFQAMVEQRGDAIDRLTAEQQQTIWEQVDQFWARPNPDPTAPPPHSTGAAIDLTLVDETDTPLDMGSPIDEISPRSFPDHFAESCDPMEQQFHHHRQLLFHVMHQAGFQRHPKEWWHFCYGDQMWAWLTYPHQPPSQLLARYGRMMD